MILKKIIIGLFFACFLNGCVQNTALLGPAYTFASTGNIYHTSLSYGSSRAIKKLTGKTSTENVKSFLNSKKASIEEEENYDQLFLMVKRRIEKTRKILNLANQ
tara:strand:+ start:186 stop:497 length:312 start_codon:yes stop_codon:yes gene_type:complete